MIETKRLVLRPFRADDLSALHAMFSDRETMRYWDRPAWDDIEITQRTLDMFMRDAPDEHLEYAVDLGGDLIGRVAMWKRYEVGYIFARAHWGNGYASEAMGSLLVSIDQQFPEPKTLTAELDPENAGSVKLLKRLGFQQVGYAEKNFQYDETTWTDTVYFALDRH